MTDAWVTQLQQLNQRLREELSDQRLGERSFRRAVLEQQAGPIERMNRLAGQALEDVLNGGVLVGVDGSINTYGGQFPYYIDLLRSLAKPSRGNSIFLKGIHCPMPPEGEADADTAQRTDNEVRQNKLAHLEVQAALQSIDVCLPQVILMDGPLVRFDMRAKDSFSILKGKVIRKNILLLGCIENIESKVLDTVMGPDAPPGWRNRFDRDILWGTLDYGEIVKVTRPGKGLPRQEGDEQACPLRTWFMRASLEPGVVGVEMLEEQVTLVGAMIDYLFTLSPPDGRGIPIWLDLVDREVRLTNVELDAYFELLDPQVKRFFQMKRDARFY